MREAVYDVMHFWLKRGASGFRMDVINFISKVSTYPDADKTLGDDHEFHPGNKFFVNGPRFHDYMREMNEKVLSKYDCYTGIEISPDRGNCNTTEMRHNSGRITWGIRS